MIPKDESAEGPGMEAGGGFEEPAQDEGGLEFPEAPELKEIPIETYETALVATEAALIVMGYPQEGADRETVQRFHALEAGDRWLQAQGEDPFLREEQADRFAEFLGAVATRYEKSAEVASGTKDLFGVKPKEDVASVRERRFKLASKMRDLVDNIRARADFERAKVIG